MDAIDRQRSAIVCNLAGLQALKQGVPEEIVFMVLRCKVQAGNGFALHTGREHRHRVGDVDPAVWRQQGRCGAGSAAGSPSARSDVGRVEQFDLGVVLQPGVLAFQFVGQPAIVNIEKTDESATGQAEAHIAGLVRAWDLPRQRVAGQAKACVACGQTP